KDYSEENKSTKGTFLIRSTDNGQTWSKPTLVFANYNTSSPIRELSNGWLLISLHGTDEIHDYSAVAISKDNGYTWSEPRRIYNPYNQSLNETDVVEIEKGKLLAVMRSNSLNMHY